MTTILIDGLCFGEGPRWHDNKLWFSDMHANTVYTVDMAGQLETIVTLDDDQPSGLGWLPNGQLLIVSMTNRQLLTLNNGELSVFADLSGLASYHCNDMVTDSLGRSYVGNFGYDLHSGSDQKSADLIMVNQQGEASVVASDLVFPNGSVITPDGKQLIIAETMAARLTAFDIGEDGSLTHRRVWAQLEGAVPDGICLDEAGGIWVASPISNEALRVLEGGEVTDRIPVENQAFACMLGGEDRKTLFILTSGSSRPDSCKTKKSAKVEYQQVTIAGAGLP